MKFLKITYIALLVPCFLFGEMATKCVLLGSRADSMLYAMTEYINTRIISKDAQNALALSVKENSGSCLEKDELIAEIWKMICAGLQCPTHDEVVAATKNFRCNHVTLRDFLVLASQDFSGIRVGKYAPSADNLKSIVEEIGKKAKWPKQKIAGELKKIEHAINEFLEEKIAARAFLSRVDAQIRAKVGSLETACEQVAKELENEKTENAELCQRIASLDAELARLQTEKLPQTRSEHVECLQSKKDDDVMASSDGYIWVGLTACALVVATVGWRIYHGF